MSGRPALIRQRDAKQIIAAAKKAGVDPATIVKIESAGQGTAPGRSYVLQKVVTALARGGAMMTNNGVELVKKPRR